MIGIVSNAFGVAHGGGVAAIAAWASVLRTLDDVELHFSFETSAAEIEAMYGIDVSDVDIRHGISPTAGGRRWRAYRRGARFDLLVLQRSEVPFPSAARSAALFVEFPFQRRLRWRERRYLGRFAGVAANSEFTASWIARRWRRDAAVIPPAVPAIAPRDKQPRIVSIGRFTEARRGKHQREMVEAFRRLHARGAGDWSLDLVGSIGNHDYLESVRDAAEDLPVTIHADVDRETLARVVGAARIVWHACGADHDEEATPELMEHFGIATAEAMSAGCIPVVIAKGGQREVAGEAFEHFTWSTWDECVDRTLEVIARPERHAAWARQARAQAARYAPDRFRDRLLDFARGLHPGYRSSRHRSGRESTR